MRLIFVYNAKSGKQNTIIDSIHKVVSPSTYNCNLCSLTFGLFNEKEQWKNFREQSNHKMEFYHIDEFQKEFSVKEASKYTFPIILSEENLVLKIVVTPQRLNELKTIDLLIEEIISKSN